MIRKTFSLVLLWLAHAQAAAPAAAQTPPGPHGDLPAGLDCSACHTADAWTPLKAALDFDHGSESGFRLTGAHARSACASCHLDLRFDGPDIAADDCSSCHADVHEARMVQPCVSCHDTRSFRDVDGEAVHARTSFPLAGAHRQITCESCHTNDVGGAYTSLDTDCVSCHRSEYEGARTLDHAGSGFSTDCTECHGTVGWSDAPVFDHAGASGGFTLVGAHTGLRCASCHVVPGMQPLFTAASQDDCVACHQDDYDREHAGWGVSADCTACHDPTAWSPSTFDHDGTYFPIQSGAHRDRWSSCADCHTGGVPSSFTCLSCHEHAQARMDDEHREEPGYAYESSACLSCHPRGDSD